MYNYFFPIKSHSLIEVLILMKMFNDSLLRSFICLAAIFAASNSWAHARWKLDGSTPPRSDISSNKTGPCGDQRTDNPAVFQAGETIEVEFESVIYHQGEFRIAFSEKDDQGFDENVLADNITDYQDQKWRKELITLPNIACDDCTLQLIQTMPDSGGLYYSCADIKLVEAIVEPDPDPVDPDPVEPEPTTGGSGGSASFYLCLLFSLCIFSRRRIQLIK